MRRILLVPFAALLLAAVASADEAPKVDYDTLFKEYQAAVNEFFAPYREAKKAGKTHKLDYSQHPRITYAARFETFAKQNAGTPAAAKALVQILSNGPQGDEQKNWAIDTLLKDHLESKDLRTAIFRLRWMRPEAIDTIARKSPHKDIRGYALMTLGQLAKDKDPQRALKIFLEVRQKYGDEKYGSQTLAQKVDGEIYEVEHLGVGKEAPEIIGEDIEGVAMKLSDFRGKVVLLDFWGDW